MVPQELTRRVANADTLKAMRRFRAATAFPAVDLDDAGQATAGRIEVSLDLIDHALDRAARFQDDEELGTERLVARPLDPVTALITSD
jgi:hypothetical protein